MLIAQPSPAGRSTMPPSWGNVSRGHKSIALCQDTFLVSNDHRQLPGGYVARFILRAGV
jgi:hypothetical protein